MDNTEVVNLYVVVDRISKKAFTGIIPAQNDLVAVFGFLKWLKGQNDGIDPKSYALCHCGKFTSDGQIIETEFYRIVTGDNAQNYYDNEVIKALEEEEN